MTNSDQGNVADVPFFEILDFVPNTEFSIIDKRELIAPFSLPKFEKWLSETESEVLRTDKEWLYKQVKSIYLKLSGIIKDENDILKTIPKGEKTQISKQEASAFSACFGMPKNESEREKWFVKDYSARVAFVQNKLGERTMITSFTKIL